MVVSFSASLRASASTPCFQRTLDEAQPLLGGGRLGLRYSVTTARKTLSTRTVGVRGGLSSTASDIEMADHADIRGIFWPWNVGYRLWWHVTALVALMTIFLAPYQVAFEEIPLPGTSETMLNAVFVIDILVNFNLAFYKDETIVYDRREIARGYLTDMFWVDVVGGFPFIKVASLYAEKRGYSSDTELISLLRLLHLVRLHRMKKLFEDLVYDARVSLLLFTLLRNFALVMITCHVQACCMYFLARLNDFDDDTWLGSYDIKNGTGFERYVTSLYWSITTFTSVGYGDFSPSNPLEKIAVSFFMLLDIAIGAFIIGSITLRIVKGDSKTGEYRDSLEILHQYGQMHSFEQPLLNKLKRQLRLEFRNREVADEQVLQHFPSQTRRKILRRLYKHHLVKTEIMSGMRSQFVDAFLISCKVEIFSPGEEICERGSISSDLFLLVGGIAEVQKNVASIAADLEQSAVSFGANTLEAGELIGAIGFFTESPQIDSVVSLTVCKTLTMSRSTYKLLAQDHPSSAGKILQNLLSVVETSSMKNVGSQYDLSGKCLTLDSFSLSDELESIIRQESDRRHAAPPPLTELVAMHMRKHLDDQTTRFNFAASRGDTRIISLMCDNGFDPNNADYDKRTALMIASMKGNLEVVELLLQHNASPNKRDMHGSNALLEATKFGHEDIVELLFQHGANLCMPESKAASILCEAVFQGDILLLQRLLRAGIDVNAANYDKRTAAHVAAAEGNLAAVRILAEHGANLVLPDRWGNVVKSGEAGVERQVSEETRSQESKCFLNAIEEGSAHEIDALSF